MNKKQLSQLRHLNKEIELLKKQINDVELSIVPQYTIDSVKGSDPEFPYTEHSIKISGLDLNGYHRKVNRLKKKLQIRLEELMKQVDELNEYIASIDDSEIRQILTLRYMNGLTWEQVAAHVGGGNTADSVRKICSRFLEKN